MPASNEINQAIQLMQTEKTNKIIGKSVNCEDELKKL